MAQNTTSRGIHVCSQQTGFYRCPIALVQQATMGIPIYCASEAKNTSNHVLNCEKGVNPLLDTTRSIGHNQTERST